VKYISREEHGKISKLSNVERDDILYSKVGTYGIPQIVNVDREFSIFVSLALLKPNKQKVRPKYLEVALKSSFIKSQADRLVSGIGVPDLHLREIKTFLVPLPSLLKQDQFIQLVNKYEGIIKQRNEAERQADHLFQSLLQRTFCGEL
jgi:type I restriction enzyme, S subunit